MEQKANRRYHLLVLIASPKLADKAADLFLKSALPIQYRFYTEGTASSQIMDTLDLGSSDKGVLISTVPESFGKLMLGKLHSELRLDAVNSGKQSAAAYDDAHSGNHRRFRQGKEGDLYV